MVVLAWLIREVLAQGADDEELSRYCDPNDVARLRVAVEPFELGSVTERCGVDAPSLVALRDAVRRSGQVAVLSGTGVNFARHGLLTEWLRWVLLIVTGSVDRPGGMWISPGWVTPLENREHWVHGAADASDRPGPASRPDLRMLSGEYPAVAMVDEIEAGNIRGLLVFGGSPLTAAPDPARLRVALQSLDFLAVADVVENELTSLATHVLPVAAMLERSDAPRNKIHTGFADAVVPLGANRKPAWWVWAQLAQRLGVDILDGVHPDECTDEILYAKCSRTAAAGPTRSSPPVRAVSIHRACGDGYTTARCRTENGALRPRCSSTDCRRCGPRLTPASSSSSLDARAVPSTRCVTRAARTTTKNRPTC